MLGMGLVVDIIWWQMGDDQFSIEQRRGMLFVMLIISGWTTLLDEILNLPHEKPTALMEYRSRCYDWLTYHLTLEIAEWPWRLLSTLILSFVCYFAVGLNINGFPIFVSALFLYTLAFSALGLFFSVMLWDIRAIAISVPLIFCPFISPP